MNETQFYISVAAGPAAATVAVLIGCLLSKPRITGVNGISALRSEMNANFGRIMELIRQQGEVRNVAFQRLENMLLGKFAELDNRLSRIEGQRN